MFWVWGTGLKLQIDTQGLRALDRGPALDTNRSRPEEHSRKPAVVNLFPEKGARWSCILFKLEHDGAESQISIIFFW